MDLIDLIVLIGLMLFISVYGLYKALKGAKQQSVNEVLHGANVSILSSTLSVCSGFLSAISLLGFPAEIYYQGTMLWWYGIMYMIAFPLVAFIFLPVFYKLKLTSIYEYLELRFNFGCRLLASITFCLQMLLYISVALYAPALALSSIATIPLSISIVLTASLSAFYISVGGAKAGIYTSSLQMALILISMSVILSTSLWDTRLSDIAATAIDGGRLQLTDFRIDPRIRHSIWSLLIGGTGNILSLFAANQLSVQRYMAMPTLNSAKWVVLLNIPFNCLILTMYIGIGLILYHAYRFCDPVMLARDRLFPHFIVERMATFPGLIGLFLAAIYSAGLSTISASYSALGAVVIEDIIKQYMQKLCGGKQLRREHAVFLARVLPLIFCALSIAFAYLCSLTETMMLQISLSIFGVAGGPVLSVFCLGMFFPYIRGTAAFIAQVAATLFCFFIAGGALLNGIHPVGLPLDRSCDSGNVTHFATSDPTYGMVHPLNSNSWLVQLYRISYQYYSIVALLVALIVAHVVQLFRNDNDRRSTPINSDLLSRLIVRKRTQNENPMNNKEAQIDTLLDEKEDTLKKIDDIAV